MSDLNNKELQFVRLAKEYTDEFGRITWIPAKETDPRNHIYDSENNHLWTGEANMLLELNGVFEDDFARSLQRSNFEKSLKSTRVVPGLYARQPEPYLHTKHYSSVSIDEYNGMCYSIACFQEMQYLAEEMANYGKRNAWAYIEKEPNVNPYDINWREFKGIIETLKELYDVGKKTGDWNGSREMDAVIYKNINVERLSRVRLPKDRFFINVTAGFSATFLQWAHFLFTAYHTAKKPYEVTSGKMMLFYKLEAMRLLEVDNILLRHVRKYTHEKFQETYGYDYVGELHKLFFNRDPNHPFLCLSKGLTLK